SIRSLRSLNAESGRVPPQPAPATSTAITASQELRFIEVLTGPSFVRRPSHRAAPCISVHSLHGEALGRPPPPEREGKGRARVWWRPMSPPTYVFGPTFTEMRDPQQIDARTRERARAARSGNPLDPVNLFNLTWKPDGDAVSHVVLPKAITGV